MSFRLLINSVIIAALTGCSYTYRIRADIISGKLVFVPNSTSIWGGPDCIRSVSVTAVDGPAAKATKDDDPKYVALGHYWNKRLDVNSCNNKYPLIYGSKLRGLTYYKDNRYNVEAKRLSRGVLYEIAIDSEGSGYGGGKFIIGHDGVVSNISL